MSHSPITMELLLFVLPLILSPLLPTAIADQGSGSSSGSKSYAADAIIVTSILFLLVAAFVAFYIRRYGNGCLGAATDNHQEQEVDAAARGLDAAAVKSLPSIKFSEIKTCMIEKVDLAECAVCLSEFTDQDALLLLPDCCHVFHSDCIKPWLASHVTCPVCRASLEEVSSVSVSMVLDRISHVASKPSDDSDHHQTVEIEASSNSGANWSEARGGERLGRSHSTGELVIRVVDENISRTRMMAKEISPKSDYRYNIGNSHKWNCFSSTPRLDSLVNCSSSKFLQI